MGMSKKDFIALADAVRMHQNNLARTGIIEYPAYGEYWIDVLADFCKSRNSRFLRERWVGYIRGENGPNEGKYSLLKKGKTNAK